MRDQLGVLVMEESDGNIAVQLFADIGQLNESFEQLHGKPADKPSRAILLTIDHKNRTVAVRVKDLPVPEESKENAPDAYRLGEGPIWFDKEKED